MSKKIVQLNEEIIKSELKECLCQVNVGVLKIFRERQKA
jgi:hypothetical protein